MFVALSQQNQSQLHGFNFIFFLQLQNLCVQLHHFFFPLSCLSCSSFPYLATATTCWLLFVKFSSPNGGFHLASTILPGETNKMIFLQLSTTSPFSLTFTRNSTS